MYEEDKWLGGILIDDEKVLCNGTISAGIYWKGIAILIAGLIFLTFFKPVGVILIITGGVMLATAAFLKNYLRVVLTDKRAIARYGVIITQTTTLALDKLESIEVEKMLTGLAMGYSNIVITGTGSRIYRIPYVSNAQDLRAAYDKISL